MNIQRFPLGEIWTNCYIVWDSKGIGFIVDPGGYAECVAEFIRDNHIEVEYILLTHGHADHLGGIQEVRNLAQYGVAIHTEDADCLTDARKNLSAAMGHSFVLSSADKLLSDGEHLQIGDLGVEIIHTPGHTIGGVCYYIKDESDEILICGDTLFYRSIGRTDLPDGNELTLINSLRKLERFNDELKVYPGHGPSTTIGEEKKLNPYWPR